MSKQQPAPAVPTQQRASDVYRSQMALNSVLQADLSRRDLRVDTGSSDMLVKYSTGLAEHILGEAAKVAKHRGKNVVEPADLNLILLKKFGMKVNSPDVVVPRVILHHESLGAGYGSMLHQPPPPTMMNTEDGFAQYKESKAAGAAAKKRKLN